MAANASGPRRFGELAPSEWPGERLGLADSGPGSVARFGRRLLAIIIDWALAAVPAYLVIGGEYASVWQLACFGLMQIVFIPTLGGSFGHLVCRMRVVPLAGGWVGVWRPFVRTMLLLLIVPVLVWDSDQRGFHDKIPGTVLIRV